MFGDSVEIEQSSRAHARDSLRKVPAAPKTVKVASPTVAARGAKSAAAAEAGPPLLDSLPYIAGDRMVRTINRADGTYVDECTAAFPSDTGSGIEMASAGHCGPTGTNYNQGYYFTSDNTIYYTGSMENEYVSAFRENGVDAMLMSNPGNYYPLMWENTSGTYQTAQVTYSANPYEGQIVCFNGSFSGTRCGGAVVVPDDCLLLDGIWPETGASYELNMCNETETQAASMLDQDGDSGGPCSTGTRPTGSGPKGSSRQATTPARQPGSLTDSAPAPTSSATSPTSEPPPIAAGARGFDRGREAHAPLGTRADRVPCAHRHAALSASRLTAWCGLRRLIIDVPDFPAEILW
ncbi:hypothetical protein [Amycolatopsis nalaikhensis]|uniref:Serine protease n=1 Tax=Amycolatopsis nalaikhensis TaxID=715472 RepID=A0ABY8XUV3_9PSEU|nr:hypothetical protein [Amycolatopsis sp. 2-2]WIV59261.1 hypothetical protein QP939_11850 [Amycolatopsis sp. 2-2]